MHIRLFFNRGPVKLLPSKTMLNMTRSLCSIPLLLHFATLVLSLVADVGQHEESRAEELELVERAVFEASAVTHVGGLTVECNGDLFGRDLDMESCKTALPAFPDKRKAFSFGPRGTASDFDTPNRILSSK